MIVYDGMPLFRSISVEVKIRIIPDRSPHEAAFIMSATVLRVVCNGRVLPSKIK